MTVYLQGGIAIARRAILVSVWPGVDQHPSNKINMNRI